VIQADREYTKGGNLMINKKTALVTGASSGIGRACCLQLAEKGFNIIAVSRRKEKLQELKNEIQDLHGSKVHTLALDIRERNICLQALADIPNSFKQIDVLVNNAGLALGLESVYKADLDECDTVLETNVSALLTFIKALVPGMLERGKGQIVNIGSIAGRQSYPGGAVYCASKAAELALSRALGQDLVDTALRVCTIDPGLVETGFSEVRFRGDTQKAAGVYKGITALQAKDIAEAVCWVIGRPDHVQISEMVIFPTCQASAYHVSR
jgi:3-hydroxy acid dehydrogenase / malonic semialdehyde reductase